MNFIFSLTICKLYLSFWILGKLYASDFTECVSSNNGKKKLCLSASSPGSNWHFDTSRKTLTYSDRFKGTFQCIKTAVVTNQSTTPLVGQTVTLSFKDATTTECSKNCTAEDSYRITIQDHQKNIECVSKKKDGKVLEKVAIQLIRTTTTTPIPTTTTSTTVATTTYVPWGKLFSFMDPDDRDEFTSDHTYPRISQRNKRQIDKREPDYTINIKLNVTKYNETYEPYECHTEPHVKLMKGEIVFINITSSMALNQVWCFSNEWMFVDNNEKEKQIPHMVDNSTAKLWNCTFLANRHEETNLQPSMRVSQIEYKRKFYVKASCLINVTVIDPPMISTTTTVGTTSIVSTASTTSTVNDITKISPTTPKISVTATTRMDRGTTTEHSTTLQKKSVPTDHSTTTKRSKKLLLTTTEVPNKKIFVMPKPWGKNKSEKMTMTTTNTITKSAITDNPLTNDPKSDDPTSEINIVDTNPTTDTTPTGTTAATTSSFNYMYIVFGVVGLVVLILLVLVTIAVHRYCKHSKIEERRSKKEYENLNNDSNSNQFPPNLDKVYMLPCDARNHEEPAYAVANCQEDGDPYSVPYVQNDIDKLYSKPVPKSQRKDLLYSKVLPKNQRQKTENPYAEIKTPELTYAEIEATSSKGRKNVLKTTEPMYSEIMAGYVNVKNKKSNNYKNVIPERSRYANAKDSEYAEPAYCELERQ